MPDFKTVDMISRRGGEVITQSISVEAKCDLLSETIYKVLNVQSDAVIIDKNFEDGKYSYVGRVNFFICYLDTEKTIRRYECETEFTGEAVVEDNAKLFTSVTIEKTETDLSGIKVGYKAQLKVNTKVVYAVKTPCFDSQDNIVTKRQTTELSSYAFLKGSYAFNEEFSLPYLVEEVLCQKISPLIKSVTAGVGFVSVEGEAVLSVIALQSGEKRDIIREERVFPFTAEIEAEGVMPTDSVWLSVSKKSFKTDVFVDENGNKTDVNLSATLVFEGEAETRENVEVIVDAFSLTERTREERKTLKYARFNGEYTQVVNVFGAIDIGEEINAENFAVVNSYAQTLSIADGVLSGIFGVNILANTQNGIVSKKAEVPFEYVLNKNEEILSLTATKPQVSVGDKIEVKGEVVLSLLAVEPYEVSVLTDIISVGEKQKQTQAISIYIANNGEELWDISKRLSVSPEVLSSSNKDLTFPLSGRERIVVYRQL